MTNSKITAMTAAAALTGAEIVPVTQGGSNVRTTTQAIANLGGGGGTWGSITGTLSNQTDLQTALNLKANLASPTFTGTVSGITAAMVGAPSGSGTSSGANTGDQTITLTGAVTGTGTGSFATTIAAPGTLAVASTNSTATAHTHAITSSSAPGAAAALLATDASGIIGSTGTRIVKGWFTDLTVTNAIAGSVTGNAATATALQNARTIGGTSFDGTTNITVASATGGFAVSGGNLTVAGTETITSANAAASVVGPNGATNPAFLVDASAATLVNGFSVIGAASGGDVTVGSIGPGSDVNLVLKAKGSGNLSMQTAGFAQFNGGGSTTNVSATQFAWQQAFRTGNTGWVYYNTGGTSLPASTEVLTVDYQQGFGAMQYSTGAKATQRDFVIRQVTNTAVAASTITDAVTTSIQGAPLASTNITQTNAIAFQIEAGAVGASTTNSFGFRFLKQTGATNNYVGKLDSGVIQQTTTTVAALIAAATAGAGARSIVSDALAPTFGAAVTGGGAVVVPVYSTGTAWNVG